MKSNLNWINTMWNFFTTFVPFHLKFLKFWNEPARSFLKAKCGYYIIYDRSRKIFNKKIGFLTKFITSDYFKVYFNSENKLIGYKFFSRKGIFKVVTRAQRIYSHNEIISSISKQNRSYNLSLFNDINLENDNILWEIHQNYNPLNLQGKSQYYYRNEEFLVEFMVKFQIRGIFVEGTNISVEEVMYLPRYLKKYKSIDGTYQGYDEIYKGKIRNSLRLFFNEDDDLILSNRFALLNNKRELREIGRYDKLRNKVSSELYVGEKLQKSVVFVYNEDSTLVKVIHFGPDGNMLR